MKKFLIVLSIAFSIISCSKEDATSPKEPGDAQPKNQIIPLKIGNTWSYTVVMYSTLDPDEFQLNAGTSKVISNNKIDGINWFSVSESGKQNLYINKADGLYMYDTENKKAMLAYLYPAKIGDSYSVIDGKTGSGMILRVGSLNDVVTTEAGTFTCIRYDAKIGASKLIIYFCPNVGLIKRRALMDVTNYGDGPDSTWQEQRLIDYILK